MRDKLNDLVTIAGVELAYALAEVALSAHSGPEKERIFAHLSAVETELREILDFVGEAPVVRKSKHRSKVASKSVRLKKIQLANRLQVSRAAKPAGRVRGNAAASLRG